MNLKHYIKSIWLYIIIAIIISSGITYRYYGVQTKVQKSQSYKVKAESLSDTLSLSGKVSADEDVTLRFQSSGTLSWVGVKEGDEVKKGQFIASLDQREIKMRMQKYMNTFMEDRLSFDQKKDDNKEPNIWSLTDDQRRAALRLGEKAQYDLNNSVLDVELQNLSLEYANLYSPIKGIVVHVSSPYAGINITPSQAEFEIINPETLYFSALADQTDVVKLHEGMKGNIMFDSFPDIKIQGVIDHISFTPREGETGTVYEVKLGMNSENLQSYRIGMTGDVEFSMGNQSKMLTVPTSFIKEENGRKYVLKNIKGQTVKTVVETGEVFDTTTEITSGLHEGDTIYD